MSALLSELRGRGAEVGARGGRLRIVAPAAGLPVALIERARAEKDILLAALAAEAGPCPLLLHCACGVTVWRPAGSRTCWECETASTRSLGGTDG